MRKPDGYAEAQPYTGDYERLEPGAYICRVKNVKEENNNGYWQLALAFDIAEGDRAGFYGRQFDRFGGKWPGVYRQNVEDKEGKCSPFFKGLITAIEESNPGYIFDFDNEKALVGKFFGALFGEEEYLSTFDGKVKTACKCVQVRSVKSIRNNEYKIPDKKLYKGTAQKPRMDISSFDDVPAEACPF